MRRAAAASILAASFAAIAVGAAAMPAGAAGQPTCSDTLGIAVHGQHVIADYVSALHGDLAWPPAGVVGEAVAGEGADVPGGPGPGFHFDFGFAAGASFCTDSQSPGIHL